MKKSQAAITTAKDIHSFTPVGKDDTLSTMHRLFQEAPNIFRTLMCIQCLWSMPTYYRKLRAPGKERAKPLSIVEQRAIIDEARKIIANMQAIVDESEKKLVKNMPKDMPLAQAI